MSNHTDSILESALTFHRLGFTVIPVKGRGAKDSDESKRPLVKWERWQGKRPTEETVKAWFKERPLANFAVLTGSSAGLLLFDVDTKEGEESVKDFGLKGNPCVLTPRGRHYYFRWDKRLDECSTTKVGVLKNCDTRGTGGYGIAPGSIGVDGHIYRWESGDTETNLASLPPTPEWIVELLLKTKPIPKDIEPGPANWFQEVWQNGAAPGERHQMMTKIASVYASRGLPEDAIWLLMLDWNKRCNPPKPEEDFKYELRNFLENWLSGRYQSNVEEGEKEFKVLSSDTFLGELEVKIDWLVDDLIPKESLTLLHGYSGIGKSWLTLALAIEIGKPPVMPGLWLGRGTCRGKVLYIDEESHPKLLKYRYNKLLKGQGLKAKDVDVHFMSLQGLKLDKKKSVDALKGLLVELQPTLIIIDPFVSIHNLSEKDSGDMAKLRTVFKEIIHDCHVGFVVIDHENKKTDVAKSAAERLRGSSEKAAVADVQLSLTEQDGIIFLEQAKARYGVKSESVQVQIVDTTDTSTEVKVNG